MPKIKIQNNGLFYTPKSQEDLMDALNDIGSDAIIGAMLAWNYLAAVVAEAQGGPDTSSQNPYANVESEDDDDA